MSKMCPGGDRAFFERLGGWKRKKDTAIPPGHRRILKKGNFNTPPVFSFFENGGLDVFKTAIC